MQWGLNGSTVAHLRWFHDSPEGSPKRRSSNNNDSSSSMLCGQPDLLIIAPTNSYSAYVVHRHKPPHPAGSACSSSI